MKSSKPTKKPIIKHHHFFYGGVVLFLITGVILGSVTLMYLNQRGDFGGKVHAYKAGQTISNSFYQVRIDNITRSQEKGKSLTPHAGKEFVIIDLYIKNKSNKITEIFPSTQSYIKGPDGTTYGLGAAVISTQLRAGDLIPGDQIKGQLAYEVPIGLTDSSFYFEGLGSKPVIIKIN